MPGDFNKPVVTDTYANVPAYIRALFSDLAKGMDGTDTANPPTGAVRWNSTNKYWEKFGGTVWAALVDKYMIDVDTVDGLHASSFQASDATLTALAALTTAADKMIYATNVDTFTTADLTAFARSLLDDADASAALSTLGVTTYIKTLLDDADAATARGTLGLGTAAVLNAGTSASNVVQLDGTAKLPAVDGSQLTGITTGDPRARDLALITALRLATHTDSGTLGLPGGYEWLFKTDELATKTNAWFDHVSFFYWNPTVSISAYDTSGTVAFSKTYSTYDRGQALALPACTIGFAKFRIKKLGSPTGNVTVVIYGVSGTVGTNGVPTGAVLATSGAINVATLSTDETLVTFTFSTPYNASAGNYAIYPTYNGGDTNNCIQVGYVSAGNHPGNAFYRTGGAWVGDANGDVIFYLQTNLSSTPSDITLIPTAVTALTEPDDISIYVLHKAVDACTMGTDIKARVTIDNGSNWSNFGTWTELAVYDANYKLYCCNHNVSALTGTSVKWELTTLNGKNQRVRAVTALWG